jgi:hypothetical protein
MDPQPDRHEERRSRAGAAAEIVALALERDLPHLALAAAREAARSALLDLGEGPRRLAGRDLALLREPAAASPHHMAGRPAERQVLLRAALRILDRVFPRPPGAGWHDLLPAVGAWTTVAPEVGSSAPVRPRDPRSRHAGAIELDSPGGSTGGPDRPRMPATREASRPWT